MGPKLKIGILPFCPYETVMACRKVSLGSELMERYIYGRECRVAIAVAAGSVEGVDITDSEKEDGDADAMEISKQRVSCLKGCSGLFHAYRRNDLSLDDYLAFHMP